MIAQRRNAAQSLFLELAEIEEGIDWTPEDSTALDAFMHSYTGDRLRRVLVNEIAAANERAAMSKGDAHACGIACGYKWLLCQVEALRISAQPEESQTSNDGANGAPDPSERLSTI